MGLGGNRGRANVGLRRWLWLICNKTERNQVSGVPVFESSPVQSVR